MGIGRGRASGALLVLVLGAVACCGKAPGSSGGRAHRKAPPTAKQRAHAPDLSLPDVKTHARSVPVGDDRPTPEHPCGTTRVGDGEHPLDCFDGAVGDVPDAAHIVIPSAALGGGKATTLPTRVDHRLEGLEGPVRNQGASPDCTGFSLAATIDEAYAAASGHPGDVSALHLWSRYAVTRMGPAISANKNRPLAEETTWPYSVPQANAFLHATACANGTLTGKPCEVAPDKAKQEDADTHPYLTLVGATNVDSSSADAIERKLAGGQDVWFCAKIGGHIGCGKKECNLEHVAGTEDVYIRDFDARKQPGGHCMSLAGYQKTASGTYFLIHNSFGEGWGNKGYAFMHEDTFLRNVEKGATYVVEVHPEGHDAKAAASRQASVQGCPAGELRDGETATCAALCPDGGAEHGGACPETTGCSPGEVNVTGTCVTAAPSHKGTDATSGIGFSCAPGGCSYSVPKGKLGCVESTCSITCAAPRYHLASGTNGLVCTS